MHTVDLLEESLAVAQKMGYRIRQEWLEGSGGGCTINGQKWIFLDLALGPADQLDLVLDTLRRDPNTHEVALPYDLQIALGVRKAA